MNFSDLGLETRGNVKFDAARFSIEKIEAIAKSVEHHGYVMFAQKGGNVGFVVTDEEGMGIEQVYDCSK
jgi:hypothetical protein